MIPYSRQNIDKDDIQAVVNVLQSDFLTQGEQVPLFEKALCKIAQVKYSVAVNSATSALHLACLALDVGEGDLVWTSANTFVASANCALYCGAKIDFVDIDLATGNLSMSALAEKLTRASQIPKVVIPVHFAGQSCDMAALADLAKQYGFKIIEDASHALGASYQGQPVGNCQFSDITVFSFHPVKMATTGEGGALLTRSQTLAGRAKLLRSHGITRDSKLMTAAIPPWAYQQQGLGYNYRLTDMQAALGVSQLNRLDQFVEKRNSIALFYDRAFSGKQLLPLERNTGRSSVHLYVIRVEAAIREALFLELRKKGVGVNVHYMPVYWQPFYQELGFQKGLCECAEKYYCEAISLPVFPGLTGEQQQQVVDKVLQAVEKFS